jgi:hypothetical protein
MCEIKYYLLAIFIKNGRVSNAPRMAIWGVRGNISYWQFADGK